MLYKRSQGSSSLTTELLGSLLLATGVSYLRSSVLKVRHLVG